VVRRPGPDGRAAHQQQSPVADATHVALLDEEDGATISTHAIDDLVRDVRTDAPLPAH
jgi:hypothetical protein